MRHLWTRLTRLPLATLAGAFLGTLIALVAAVVAHLSMADQPSLIGFALAPLPAALGMWIDWARLWRPTRRTRFWSFSFLFLAGFAGLEAGFIADQIGRSAWALAPAISLGSAALVFLGSRALLFLSRRGRSVFGYGVICGTVRRDESERILVDAGEGLVELPRAASQELGDRRLIDVSSGSTIAVLGKLVTRVRKADPFRTEARSAARSILAVDSSPSQLRDGIRARSRAWITYLLALALGATALAWGISSGLPLREPATRGCMVKTYETQPRPGWGW